MSMHRHDVEITELEHYFRSVIDWVATTFTMTDKEMCEIEWGRLYETYHTKPYSIDHITARVIALRQDESIRCPRNIYEYVLGREQHTHLLDVRIFDEKDKKVAYKRQTERAEKEEKIELSSVCHWGECQQNTYLQTHRDGCRPCESMEQRRQHNSCQLRNALQDAQQIQRK